MELMFHGDVNISQASKFWKNMMQATSFDPDHCTGAIHAVKKLKRIFNSSYVFPLLRFNVLGTQYASFI